MVLNLASGMTSIRSLYEFHVEETRGAGTRCPAFESSTCRGCGYSQAFVEREPPVLFLRLLRFDLRRTGRLRPDGSEEFVPYRVNTAIDVPQEIDFLRSGPYRLAAVVMHHGMFMDSGHYTTVCWEGNVDGEDKYRWYNDESVGSLMSWEEARRRRYWGGTSLSRGVYFLVYVRSRFWGDAVGDGSECTPYLRDAQSVAVAKSRFRGDPVP